MKSEIVTQGMTAADLDKLDLIADVQFNEPMGSAALNRKFYGIMPHGIYRGFQAVVRGGLKVSVGDSPVNVAAVDVDGYMISVQGRRPVELTVPTGRKVYCVIEANYAVGLRTTQVDMTASMKAADIRMINADELRGNHVIVFSANLPANTTELRADQIDLAERQEADIGSDAIDRHTKNYLNPHQVNKGQIGLSDVENFGVATLEEAKAGEAEHKYMTPATTAAAITEQAGAAVSSHTGNKNNPHGVTKAQVGLGSVQDYGVATTAEAQAGTAANKYMTPALTKAAITEQAGAAVSSHTGNKNNPHAVTKAQVGLGSVQDYGVASTAEAQAGTVTNKYMTPALTKAAITEQAGAAVSSHTGNKNNPHAVTKAQVGLGNADNTSDVNKPVSNATKTELGKKVNKAGDTMTGNLEIQGAVKPTVTLPTNAADAPSGIYMNSTAAENVGDYAAYHTVVGFAMEPYSRHAQLSFSNDGSGMFVRAAHSNASASTKWHPWTRLYSTAFKPTKADVGLGSVQDYGVASTAEAQAGTAANKYMTPALTKAAITEQAGAAVSSHTGNKNNPHGVTKAQVGLGSVNDWGATGATNDASDAKYATAGAVKKAYDLANGKMTQAQGDARYYRFIKALGSADNLNNIVATGIYHNSMNANATTANNYPTTNAGYLEVFAEGSMVYQRYHSYQANNHVYYRGRYNSAWSSWRRAKGSDESTAWSSLTGIPVQATRWPTSAEVGLGSVNNWGATSATNDASDTKYATASAVKKAYDLANGKANASHTHSYLPLAGGSLTGDVTITTEHELAWSRNTDYAKIGFKNTSDADADSYMYFKTGDNGNEYFKWQMVNSTATIDLMTLKSDHLRFKGNAVYHQGFKPSPADIGAAPASHNHAWGNITGVPVYATRWPTAAEAGAAPASHTHSYLPLSGGSFTGQIRGAATGGSFASVYTRNDAPFTSTATHSGSSFAPAINIRYSHNNGYSGVYYIGDLCDSAANAGKLTIGHINRDGAASHYATFNGDSGEWYFPQNGNFNDVHIRSDRRLKTNLVKAENALSKVSKINAYHYDKKLSLDDEEYTEKEFGLIAQELEAVLPEAVKTDEQTTLKTISNSAVNALLVEAIKELKSEVEALKAKLSQAGA